MRITNHTKFPNETLREIIRFTKPSGVSGFDLVVKTAGKHQSCNSGYCYHEGCPSYHGKIGDKVVPLITMRVSFKPNFPRRGHGGEGYLPHVTFSLVENVVFILAHELRHLWQKKVPRGRRVWGARGQFSERDADAYAIHVVREWRRKPTLQEAHCG